MYCWSISWLCSKTLWRYVKNVYYDQYALIHDWLFVSVWKLAGMQSRMLRRGKGLGLKDPEAAPWMVMVATVKTAKPKVFGLECVWCQACESWIRQRIDWIVWRLTVPSSWSSSNLTLIATFSCLYLQSSSLCSSICLNVDKRVESQLSQWSVQPHGT